MFFFFSSRRRHTRCLSDWSSDVCSSDLFIRARNLAIELSTAGWRKPVNELYPSDSIIVLAMNKNISFTTASDAHSHAQLGDKFPILAQRMATLGIQQVCVFEQHNRTQLPL